MIPGSAWSWGSSVHRDEIGVPGVMFEHSRTLLLGERTWWF